MGATRFVGHVGGLAVALGVGTAVFVSAGSANADSASPDSTQNDGSQHSGAARTSKGPRSDSPFRAGATLSTIANAQKPARSGLRPRTQSGGQLDRRQTLDRSQTAVPAGGEFASPGTIFGNSIITSPDVQWTEGILRGTLGAVSTDGLPLTYSIIRNPSLGGKVTFTEVNPQGEFTYLPYMTTLTNPSLDEQFSIMVAETTAFNTFMTNIPVVGLLVPTLLQVLHRLPVVSDLLSPIIGDSQIVQFTENPFGLTAAQPVAFTYRMPSFDGTPISINYFPAVNVSTGAVSSAPVVLIGASLGNPGDTKPDAIWENAPLPEVPAFSPGIAPFRTDTSPTGYSGGGGYNVITWDSRGTFDSGGFFQLDNPFWEGRDASSIISWAISGSNPSASQIAMESANDPLLGMVGGSFAGGVQMVTAGTPDRRIDAISPWLAWNSLNDALYPTSTFKSSWATLLLLNLVQTGARLNSQIYTGLLLGNALGFLTESAQALLADSGPTMLVNNIDIPTLFIQGTADSLFTLQQAVISAQQITTANPEAPVKMTWFCGGHGLCQDPLSAGQPERNLTDSLKWLDQYVAGSGTPADSIPDFQWNDQAGHYYTSDLLPFETGFNNPTPLSYQGVGGLLGIVPVLGGSGPSATTSPLPESLFAFGQGAQARNALNLEVAPPVGTQIAGAPTVSFTYTGLGTSRAVFAQLVDNATGRVVGNMVTPVPVTLDGRQHTVEIPLENIAYTTYSAADSLTLQITSSATTYENFVAYGLINISNVQLDLPTVASS